MIKPDRHTNPDTSVLNIGAFILNKIKSSTTISYEELMTAVVDGLGKPAQENYPYALNFLYLLGKIEYIESLDSFKYNAAK